MKIILNDDIKGLGKKGEVVKVADGYGRNYLIPKGFALEMSKKNLNVYAHQKKQGEIREKKKFRTAQELSEKIGALSLTINVKAHDDENLYGSITEKDIADAIQKAGFDINKHQVIMDSHIKKLGIYTVPVKVYKDIEAKIKIWVVKE